MALRLKSLQNSLKFVSLKSFSLQSLNSNDLTVEAHKFFKIKTVKNVLAETA